MMVVHRRRLPARDSKGRFKPKGSRSVARRRRRRVYRKRAGVAGRRRRRPAAYARVRVRRSSPSAIIRALPRSVSYRGRRVRVYKSRYSRRGLLTDLRRRGRAPRRGMRKARLHRGDALRITMGRRTLGYL